MAQNAMLASERDGGYADTTQSETDSGRGCARTPTIISGGQLDTQLA